MSTIAPPNGDSVTPSASNMPEREDPDGSETPESTVRGDLWFDDGNIILEVEGREFRVHKGILAANSTVFKDMLSLAQPGKINMGAGEDCERVMLTDSADDVGHTVRALYDRSYFTFYASRQFDVAASLARLGLKYELRSLHHEAIAFFSRCFAMTLDEWDELISISASSTPSSPGDVDPTPSISRHLRTPIATMPHVRDVAAVLHSLNLDYFLPHLYMSICHTHTLPSLLSLSLPPYTLTPLLLGRERIFRSSVHTTFKWLDPSRKCDSGQCLSARTQFILRLYSEEETTKMALARWDEVDITLCGFCLRLGRVGHDEGRRVLWESLPGMFGLEDWEKLGKRLGEHIRPADAKIAMVPRG